MMLYAFEETIKLFKLGLKLFFFPSIYIKDLILDILTFLLTNIFFHSKGILKYSFILLLFSLFSCIITALTYYLFSLPPITYKKIKHATLLFIHKFTSAIKNIKHIPDTTNNLHRTYYEIFLIWGKS